VYVGSYDNRLYALLSDGSFSWSCALSEDIESCPAIDSDGRVYIGSLDNRFYSLSSDGRLTWSYRTGDDITSSASTGADGMIYFGSHDNRLYALLPAGALSWSYRTVDNIWFSSPAITSSAGIYVGSYDHRLYALTSHGALSWSYDTASAMRSSPAIGTDGRIFIPVLWDNFICFAPGGALSWSYELKGFMQGSPALGPGGTVYMGTANTNSNMYALVDSGALLWSYETGQTQSSVVTSSDGMLYIGAPGVRISALSTSGTLSWSYHLGSAFRSPSSALGSDGRIYISSGDNQFYCFMDPTPTPTATPTPGYLELRVTNGTDFSRGQEVVLEWRTNEDRYGFAGVPCHVYLGARMDPPVEDAAVTVQEVVTGGRLYLFDSRRRATPYDPSTVKPMYRNVRFPVPNMGSSGTIVFTAPGGAAGRWVFAGALMYSDGQFPAQPPVELSNGFDLH
jgi:outer membrane protein assembly factor BamB